MTEIKSLQHPMVKHLAKLRTHRSYREEKGSAVILGKKIVSELPKNVELKTIVVDPERHSGPLPQGKALFHVTEEILKKISGVPNPEPMIAEIALPSPSSLEGKQWLIALDGISDPGNLGTLLRSALALGWEGAFLTEGCADPFNDKALRAAKGATFRLPMRTGTVEELKNLIQQQHLHVYSADPRGSPIEGARIQLPLLLLLGNESHGIRPALKECASSLSIPMHSGVDSLNVAAAAAILLHHLHRESHVPAR